MDALEEIKSDIYLSIYPNPSFGRPTVKYCIPGNTKASFQIFDVIGNVIFSETLQSGSEIKIIEIPVVLKPGMYLCSIVSGDRTLSKKFVISEK